jgi:hypothetical protein
MPQATPICPTPIHICRIRVTRLNTDGTLAAGPKNSYVSAKPSHLNWTTEVEAGVDQVVVGGCDCIAVQYRGYDKLKRFNLELELTALEPALLEMMLGAPAIFDTSTIPVQIGNQWPTTLQCGQVQPAVAIEAWSDAWLNDTQSASPTRYIRYIWTQSYWQLGNGSLQNDFVLPLLTGFTRSNPAWGLGPYNDQKRSVGNVGGYYFDDVLPVATCDYQVASSAT